MAFNIEGGKVVSLTIKPPAISDGMIFVRAEHHVFAIGERPLAERK